MSRSPHRHLTPDGRPVAVTRGRPGRVPTLVFAVATVVLVSSPASASVADTTSFGTAVNLDDNGRGSSAVAIGDLNNDGTPDLVTAIRGEGLGVFLGSGGGSFGAVTKYAAPRTASSSFLRSAVIRDVNGDGRMDVISQDSRGKRRAGLARRRLWRSRLRNGGATQPATRV